MAENNKIQNFKSSGNIIVDQVGQMGITGNIVNPNWNYYVTNESGKTNYLAVQILAEIVYWYRPSIKENKTTGIPEFEKRFKHDKYLQRSYYQLEENYNCSKKQAQDALKTLIRIGVVIQHLSDGIHGGNVMYLELVPDVLKRISTDVKEKRSHRNSDSKNVPSNKNDITSLQKYDDVDTNLLLPNDKNEMTYTDINIEKKEENNIETTTITESVPDRIVPATVSESCIIECGSDKLFNLTKELFINYNLSDKDISEIISIAQFDFNKITKAHKVIVNYKKPILNGMYQYAIRKKYITENPMDSVVIFAKYRQVVRKTGKTQVYNTEELESLNSYLDSMYSETHDTVFLAVKLNFLLGLRVGELVALKWDDVVDNKLHVVREEVRNQTTNSLQVVEHTKTNHDRFVTLVPKAKAILDLIKNQSEYIFMRDGARITARQINYVLEKYAERMGVSTKSSHKIRKTYASNLNAKGVPLDCIREELGHTDASTTLAYIYNPLTETETYNLIVSAL